MKYENKILRKRLLSLPVAKSCLQSRLCFLFFGFGLNVCVVCMFLFL